jgi:hypothetical protein
MSAQDVGQGNYTVQQILLGLLLAQINNCHKYQPF